MRIPTILAFHHFNFLRIAFILNAVIHNEVGFAAVINQGFSQFPYGMRRVFFTPQIIINRIMTDIVQMISQISTSIVDRSTDHILHIALFSDFHSVIISDNWVYTTPSESPVNDRDHATKSISVQSPPLKKEGKGGFTFRRLLEIPRPLCEMGDANAYAATPPLGVCRTCGRSQDRILETCSSLERGECR